MKRGKPASGSGQSRPKVQLPRNAIERVSMGHSFAEYDSLLLERDVHVRTPALMAAQDRNSKKCFYIGRRGTGKTAITLLSVRDKGGSVQIHPQILAPLRYDFRLSEFKDFRQRAFRSLVYAFDIAIQLEFALFLKNEGALRTDRLPVWAARELEIEDSEDFDLRALRAVNAITGPLRERNDAGWIKETRKPKQLSGALGLDLERRGRDYSILVDRIDETWDGSDENVIFLSALMHACVEVNSRLTNARVLLFLRENVFERVRSADTEFSRLETFVLGLDWTEEKLLELIERRLNHPFSTRLPVDGTTWAYFFDNPEEAKKVVFGFCLRRPRDVLTYCELAIDVAKSRNHEQVEIEDVLSARKRFSDSRIKDLWDEYEENYPRIELVLRRFAGLGWRFSMRGIDLFLKALITDEQVKKHCSSWLFRHSTPETFARLLYQIGFVGYLDAGGNAQYRSLGPQSTSPPALDAGTELVIHPVYRDALDLQDVLVGPTESAIEFAKEGATAELPEAIDLSTYVEQLDDLEQQLKTLPHGRTQASEFEDVIGNLVRLCFYRALVNVEAKPRTVGGAVVRDWVASNRGQGGFWESVRIRFKADEAVWECKNYEQLKAEDFHQMGYYLGGSIGNFGLVAYRGEMRASYFEHLKRLFDKEGHAILLLGQRDLLTFIRQARSGRVKDAHIQDRYDELLRRIS